MGCECHFGTHSALISTVLTGFPGDSHPGWSSYAESFRSARAFAFFHMSLLTSTRSVPPASQSG